MYRKLLFSLCICCLLISLPLAAGANPEFDNSTGQVNWESNIIEAMGIGIPPATIHHPAQAKWGARRAAIVDAQRRLLEIINDVQVDAETSMANLALSNDTVRSRVSGLLKGARITREQQNLDGSYQVVLAVKLYGQDGLAGTIAERIAPPVPQPLPPVSSGYVPYVPSAPAVPAVPYTPSAPAAPSVTPAPVSPYHYTGVVIDARGLDLDRSMGPMVYDTDGRAIYGNQYVEHSFVMQNGLVEYASSPDMIARAESGQSRAGSNPLYVKAIAVKDHNRNVIISREDGDAILAANAASGFIPKCAVVLEH